MGSIGEKSRRKTKINSAWIAFTSLFESLGLIISWWRTWSLKVSSRRLVRDSTPPPNFPGINVTRNSWIVRLTSYRCESPAQRFDLSGDGVDERGSNVARPPLLFLTGNHPLRRFVGEFISIRFKLETDYWGNLSFSLNLVTSTAPRLTVGSLSRDN